MLKPFRKTPDEVQALDRIESWTRQRFDLSHDAVVVVSEIACAQAGCPPLETVVAFWAEGGERRQFKLFKPVAEVVVEDLPPAWMKNALLAMEGFECSCC